MALERHGFVFSDHTGADDQLYLPGKGLLAASHHDAWVAPVENEWAERFASGTTEVVRGALLETGVVEPGIG